MRRIHPGTTVEISPTCYSGFRVISIVDCNVVFQKSIDELADKYGRGELKLKIDMPGAVVEQLRDAVIESVVVDQRTQDMLL
jgi:hypothetical protein